MAKQFIFIGDGVDYHKLRLFIVECYLQHESDILFAKNYCDGFIDALTEADLISEDTQDELVKYNHLRYSKLI